MMSTLYPTWVQSVQSVQAGQSCLLQFSVRAGSPTHCSPPPARLGSTHSRTLVREPPPQERLHSDQSVQGVQSVQGLRLQVRSSSPSPLHPPSPALPMVWSCCNHLILLYVMHMYLFFS